MRDGGTDPGKRITQQGNAISPEERSDYNGRDAIVANLTLLCDQREHDPSRLRRICEMQPHAESRYVRSMLTVYTWMLHDTFIGTKCSNPQLFLRRRSGVLRKRLSASERYGWRGRMSEHVAHLEIRRRGRK